MLRAYFFFFETGWPRVGHVGGGWLAATGGSRSVLLVGSVGNSERTNDQKEVYDTKPDPTISHGYYFTTTYKGHFYPIFIFFLSVFLSRERTVEITTQNIVSTTHIVVFLDYFLWLSSRSVCVWSLAGTLRV